MDDKARAEKEWKAKHITGKFPLLEHANGDLLWESSAIGVAFAEMAPNSGLMGQTKFQTAQVHQWIGF